MKKIAGDAGSVTVEAALALSSLVIVAAGIIGGVSTMAAYIAAVDIAGAAARSHALGVPYQPADSDVSIGVAESGGLVTVEVTVPAALMDMRATAVFPAEVGAA